MKKLLIASTSTLHGGAYLEYLFETLKIHFKGISTILFIPYARPAGITHEEYTAKVKTFFIKLNIKVVGLHEYSNSYEAVLNAEALFTGGGNTFLLVHDLYKNNVMSALQLAIEKGTPYLGTSAGSNICGVSMKTTNDMPIIYPPSFDTIGATPFNINPHYLDPDLQSKHMGETRETRIKEFHQFNNTPVLGLREGSWLEVNGNVIVLRGSLSARLFRPQEEPVEIETNANLGFL